MTYKSVEVHDKHMIEFCIPEKEKCIRIFV